MISNTKDQCSYKKLQTNVDFSTKSLDQLCLFLPFLVLRWSTVSLRGVHCGPQSHVTSKQGNACPWLWDGGLTNPDGDQWAADLPSQSIRVRAAGRSTTGPPKGGPCTQGGPDSRGIGAEGQEDIYRMMHCVFLQKLNSGFSPSPYCRFSAAEGKQTVHRSAIVLPFYHTNPPTCDAHIRFPLCPPVCHPFLLEIGHREQSVLITPLSIDNWP